jgi:hypothetical protein
MSIYRYADAFTIMRIMGHSTITLSQRYVHPTPETTEKAFDALELASKTAEERRSGVATIPATVQMVQSVGVQ